MLSGPTGLGQQGAAGFVRCMKSVSIVVRELGLFTVTKFPKVFPCVFDTVNTVLPFLTPVKTYGICVVLEYSSTARKRSVDPPAVILISAVVVSPAALWNWIEGPGFP